MLAKMAARKMDFVLTEYAIVKQNKLNKTAQNIVFKVSEMFSNAISIA